MRDKEVLKIMGHLALSVIIIIAYVLTVIIGKTDMMLQSAVLIIVGFWFGAVNQSKKSVTDLMKKPKKEADSSE